ncbi:hypothetical protein ACHAPJ_006636 [Fusarium lateritium]
MADLDTAATLTGMPTEILCMVGPYLGDEDLSSITRVSKRLRRIFLPLHFRDVSLVGSMARLALRLASFLDERSVSTSGPIWQYVQYVRFRIVGTDESDHTAVCLATESAIELIGDFFRKASGLHHAAFDFWVCYNDPQKAQFTQLLRSTERWSGPPSVYLDQTSLITSKSIIHQYLPGALEAAQITVWCDSEQYNMLKAQCPTLKRLYLTETGGKSHGNTARLMIRSMDHNVVNKINADFRQLEWLVLKEDELCLECIRKPSSQSPEFLNHLNQTVENLVQSLRAMPRLTRFACTLARQRLHNCLIRQNWSETGGREVTDAELDAWYSALVLCISKSVPRLEHLCIASGHYVFYRGTERVGRTVMEVRREEFDNPGQRYTDFPPCWWTSSVVLLESGLFGNAMGLEKATIDAKVLLYVFDAEAIQESLVKLMWVDMYGKSVWNNKIKLDGMDDMRQLREK